MNSGYSAKAPFGLGVSRLSLLGCRAARPERLDLGFGKMLDTDEIILRMA
jgi:hypothetical protein